MSVLPPPKNRHKHTQTTTYTEEINVNFSWVNKPNEEKGIETWTISKQMCLRKLNWNFIVFIFWRFCFVHTFFFLYVANEGSFNTGGIMFGSLSSFGFDSQNVLSQNLYIYKYIRWFYTDFEEAENHKSWRNITFKNVINEIEERKRNLARKERKKTWINWTKCQGSTFCGKICLNEEILHFAQLFICYFFMPCLCYFSLQQRQRHRVNEHNHHAK